MYHIGMCYFHLENYKSAKSFLERAFLLEPRMVSAKDLFHECTTRLGEPDPYRVQKADSAAITAGRTTSASSISELSGSSELKIKDVRLVIMH